MKVAIIGYGFVGKALDFGLNNSTERLIIDPKIGTDIKNIPSFNPDIIFLCLPTPMLDDGSQDISIINNVISKLKKEKKDTVFVIKSTVLPNNLELIQSSVSNIVYNPEFLRENTANDDFINADFIVFGGDIDNCKKVSNFYKLYTKCKCKEYIYTDIISASLLKYSINSFLALKVGFFNELNSIFIKSIASSSELDWKDFTDLVSQDKRIGVYHMDVPGHDGRKGFGGACLPKDLMALYSYSKDIGVESSIIKSVILSNNKIRSVYQEDTIREMDQNITFNKEF